MEITKGKALGTVAIPMELLQIGGIHVARLLHALIAACRLQREGPVCWKGGRLFNIPRTGSSLVECAAQRGILINDQIAAVNGKLLRPPLFAFGPHLVSSPQAVVSIKRCSVLTAHCSWALFLARLRVVSARLRPFLLI